MTGFLKIHSQWHGRELLPTMTAWKGERRPAYLMEEWARLDVLIEELDVTLDQETGRGDSPGSWSCISTSRQYTRR